MVVQPDKTDIRITDIPNRITNTAARECRRATSSDFMSNAKSVMRDKTDNRVTITLDEAARLLNISAVTAKLWSDMGLLRTSTSSGNIRTVKLTDIITFLSKEKSPVSTQVRIIGISKKSGPKGQDRKKLAKINIRAITKLTKQSVFEIDHLGGTPKARTGK